MPLAPDAAVPNRPHHVLFVFVDGVGLGPADADNPLSTFALPAFETLAGDHRWTADAPSVDTNTLLFRPIDANLGVPGLPQSGTGQATLFTGVNCAEIVGRHFGPYPHSDTHAVIAEHNLFAQARALDANGCGAAFANAYPPAFFEYARRRNRWTVTTLACREAGVRLRTTDDVVRGRALTAEITGRAWREQLGIGVPLLTEEQAGEQLVLLQRQYRLTVFEYYLTDKAGHHRLDDPAAVLHALDRLFAGILKTLDPADSLLIVTSDHGNVEDLSTKSHTRNPVPLVAYGAGASSFRQVDGLMGVTPALLDVLRAA